MMTLTRDRLVQFMHDLTIFMGLILYALIFVWYQGWYQFVWQSSDSMKAVVIGAYTIEDAKNQAIDEITGTKVKKR